MSSPSELIWFCLVRSGFVWSDLVSSGFVWSGLILHLVSGVLCRGMTRWREYVDLHQIDELAVAPQDTVLTCPLPGLTRVGQV